MEIFIGIDGGGTHTRAIAVDCAGNLLGTAEAGGCNPSHAPDAETNVQDAIRKVVTAAGANLADVVGLVAGLAGLDNVEDAVRAERQTAVEGLNCPRMQVNDAVVAHAGALQSQPGIIAISGTGSIVFGINESGQHIRNYDFQHYAPSAAGHLARSAVHRILAGDALPKDTELVAQVLAFWQAETLSELDDRAFGIYPEGEAARSYRFGAMGSLVTEAALSGSPLARAVCEWSAETLSIGIRLVASRFTSSEIFVVLIGGAVRSAAMQSAIARMLTADLCRRFQIVEPAFSPVMGAALMALQKHGIKIDSAILGNLHASDRKLTAESKRN